MQKQTNKYPVWRDEFESLLELHLFRTLEELAESLFGKEGAGRLRSRLWRNN